ncbi:uncharacterized protein LOC142333153 isoform X2 [Lycorma delicatula]|uniref:uncharacterized protein LOC142333153 isoform X2 n=1 Tax=Lycorma delicatula TaxID=130591 RepID=UPI003F50FD82
MSRKAFHISVDLDVHAVSCPGVWLCPKGAVLLRVAMFGLSENTKTVKPCFPLIFHERFRFRKLLKSVNSLSCLQEVLKSRHLHMQMVHLATGPTCCPATVLAQFKSPLIDVFYPNSSDRGLNAGVDLELLFTPTPSFPGILSPKVEVSTRVIIEEVINYPSAHEDSWIINPVVVTSKKLERSRSDESNVIRQRPVCHSDGFGASGGISDHHVCKCYGQHNKDFCENKSILKNSQSTEKHKIELKPGSTHEKKKSKVKKHQRSKSNAEAQQLESPQPCSCFTARESNTSVACDCLLCQKYNDCFQTTNSDSPASSTKSKGKKRFSCFNKKQKKKSKDKKDLSEEQLEKLNKQTLRPDSPSEPGLSTSDQEEYFCPVHRVQIRNPHYNSKMTSYDLESLKNNRCKCCIYSCPEWQRNKPCKSRSFHEDIFADLKIHYVPRRKTHRQIFYSQLEEYYRKLYNIAQERLAREEVLTFA